MEAEVVEALGPMPGGLIADGTVGGGGHAAAILRCSAPTGRLVGCDRDAMAVEAATVRLSEFASRFEIRRGKMCIRDSVRGGLFIVPGQEIDKAP